MAVVLRRGAQKLEVDSSLVTIVQRTFRVSDLCVFAVKPPVAVKPAGMYSVGLSHSQLCIESKSANVCACSTIYEQNTRVLLCS